jgi:hypothetical protein
MLPELKDAQSERSWELSELASIDKDHYVLKTFQTLKYLNSKFATKFRLNNENRLLSLISILCSRSFGKLSRPFIL